MSEIVSKREETCGGGAGVPNAPAHRLTRSDPAQANIQAIARLEEQILHGRSGADRIGSGITQAAGTMVFVFVHVVLFASWIGVNVNLVPGVSVFDPYPFNFLTFVVSLEAIFLSLFVLNSQNRMTREADRRAQLEFQVNLLAEQENTKTLEMLQRICQHLGLEITADDEVHRLSERTDVDRLASEARQAIAEGRVISTPGRGSFCILYFVLRFFLRSRKNQKFHVTSSCVGSDRGGRVVAAGEITSGP